MNAEMILEVRAPGDRRYAISVPLCCHDDATVWTEIPGSASRPLAHPQPFAEGIRLRLVSATPPSLYAPVSGSHRDASGADSSPAEDTE